jgi:hypothetical protein
MFPHFLCIGAQKAGTTWLHENLTQQSEIWLPPVKEIHFLDHAKPSFLHLAVSRFTHHKLARANARAKFLDLLRGRAAPAEARLALRLAYWPRDWAWYESLLPDDPDLVSGEICPGYARLSGDVIQEVTRRNPRVRVIYLLRDPIDRAWSAVAMHFRMRHGTSVCDSDPRDVIARLTRPKTLSHCEYGRNMTRWLEHVPPEQIHFGFFDRIIEDPNGCLAEVLEFLGVTSRVASRTAHVPVNTSRGEKMSPEIERVIARLLKDEALSLHRRFGNRYTEQWLARAEAAAG